VLKPQREGGGNNTYGEDIPDYLEKIDKSTWKGFILQELIETAPLSNSIYRNGQINAGRVICELGVYGVCVWRTAHQKVEILHNSEAGWLLRTKAAESHEGGVAAGFGALDSVYLTD